MTPEQREELDRCIFREANDAFLVLSPGDLHVVEANPAAQRLTGLRRKELLGMRLEDLLEGSPGHETSDLVRACNSTAYLLSADGYRIKTEQGWRPIHVSASRVHTEEAAFALLVIRDVSHQQQLAEKLEHSLRMEAIGRLSGGVAHEFNNLLTVINGYATMIQTELDADSPHLALVQEITRAGERAANVTRQLLAFGRKQPVQPAVLDLNRVICSLQATLGPLLGADLDIELDLCDDPTFVLVDPGQIEQIVLNLAINARDAMPRGGTLRLETTCLRASDTESASAQLPARDFVQLVIRDDGVGMAAETIPHIFEPFFTTKDERTGTGLGLSMVYGAVQSCGGHIEVESVVGKGTAFTIFLPRVAERAELTAQNEALPNTQGGSETILVVEDEPGVRGFVSAVLESAGYNVISAEDGLAGLEASRGHDGRIDLVMTDMIMPRMGGVELIETLQRERLEAGVLLMTGCADETIQPPAPDLGSEAWLQKPFSAEELIQAARAALDRAALT